MYDQLEDMLMDAAAELRCAEMFALARAVDEARVKLTSRPDVPPASGTRLCVNPMAAFGLSEAAQ